MVLKLQEENASLAEQIATLAGQIETLAKATPTEEPDTQENS